MKMRINEFAKLTGVSVRTLHYYDEIGLLKPSYVDGQNGYRFYDENSLLRMQEILFYRELDFPLKSICEILSSPHYDKQNALKEQRRLLCLKQERLGRLISALDSAMKGESVSMRAFDNSEYEAEKEKYRKEAKERWGSTAAYKQFEQQSSERSEKDNREINRTMESLIREFADCMKSGAKPEDSTAQELVKRWQDFITESYYNCTKEILSGLGEMYAADERFKANIDKHGEGSAEFMAKAIKAYCD